jgi:antirestriction protein
MSNGERRCGVHENEPTKPNESEQGQSERPEIQPRPLPRVYVASLSDYNSGRLYGKWLDAATTGEELYRQVSAMLAASPTPGAEEFAIHDYENFGPVRISEYESLESVTRIARGIAEHGPAFAHWASLVESTDAETLGRFEDNYEGHFADLEAYGESIIEMYGFERALEDLPDLLAPYVQIDTAAFARDMELGGSIMTSEGDGGIYVFGSDW